MNNRDFMNYKISGLLIAMLIIVLGLTGFSVSGEDKEGDIPSLTDDSAPQPQPDAVSLPEMESDNLNAETNNSPSLDAATPTPNPTPEPTLELTPIAQPTSELLPIPEPTPDIIPDIPNESNVPKSLQGPLENKIPSEVPSTSVSGAVKGSGIRAKTLPILENITTSIENPVDLRDPFKVPSLGESNKSTNIQNRPYWVDNGTITNIGGGVDPSTINIENLQITGILLGPQRRVMVKVNDTQLVLKEGMRFGPQKEIELKAIMPAGVSFVEKIKNIYNQEEYIETIVPVRENKENTGK